MKQQNVDSQTGEVVPREDIARGYETGKGQYLIVEDEEFEAVQVESTRTIEIDQFVPRNEIDDRYIDSPYYIAPDGEAGQLDEQGRSEAAVKCLRTALRVAPDYADAMFNLALLLQRTNQYDWRRPLYKPTNPLVTPVSREDCPERIRTQTLSHPRSEDPVRTG